jgi:hypothetical protein
MAQKSNTQRGGRYVQGGVVDDFTNRLGWWERTVFPKSPTDVPLVLTAKYNKRPDSLAYDLYGKSGLMWFILQYNSISDVNTFVAGLSLILPTRDRLFGELLINKRG